MTLAVYNRVLIDDKKNVIGEAEITVTDENTGQSARLFSDRAGLNQISNPFTSQADGRITFFARGSAYRVDAEKDGETFTFRYEAIGTAAEFDFEALLTSISLNTYYFQTQAELFAFVPDPDAGVIQPQGAVTNDPTPANNGYYTWDPVEEEWNFSRPFLEDAAGVFYDNTTSGLASSNVQGAIDELALILGDVESVLDAILGE